MEVDTVGRFAAAIREREEQLGLALERVLAAARPGAVFSAPVNAGNYTVITANEVISGGGFGSGGGMGQGGPRANTGTLEGTQPVSPEHGAGFGFGGGGGAVGRPVAAIVIGPDGVKVRPVVDVTKIAIAAMTTWAGMFLAMRGLRRMRKMRRRM